MIFLPGLIDLQVSVFKNFFIRTDVVSWYYDTKHYDNQHNDIQYNYTQHDYTQHNYTQHNI
jgi:hypothetical protein